MGNLLAVGIGLNNHVLLKWSFPNPDAFHLVNHHHEVALDVFLFRDLFILLHKTEVHLCFLADFYPELRVVEPLLVSIQLEVFGNVGFPLHPLGTHSAVRLAVPFAHDAVGFPLFWEYFRNVSAVEMDAPVLVAHPPSPV